MKKKFSGFFMWNGWIVNMAGSVYMDNTEVATGDCLCVIQGTFKDYVIFSEFSIPSQELKDLSTKEEIAKKIFLYMYANKIIKPIISLN